MRALRTLIVLAALLAACAATWSPAAASAADQPGSQAHTAAARPVRAGVYVVRPGDTLSVIAARHYGGRRNWPALWDVNRRKIGNPNMIAVGQRLSLRPEKLTARIVRRALGAIPKPAVHVVSVPVHTAPAHAAPARHHYNAPAPVAPSGGGHSAAPGGFEACIIQAESGGDPAAYNPASGASGLYGFLLSSWDSLGLGYPGGAYTAPPSVQRQGFQIEYSRVGTSAWAPYDGCL